MFIICNNLKVFDDSNHKTRKENYSYQFYIRKGKSWYLNGIDGMSIFYWLRKSNHTILHHDTRECHTKKREEKHPANISFEKRNIFNASDNETRKDKSKNETTYE